jgi:hypothetical protein
VKEGFARSSSKKERRCLQPFQKAKREVVEELRAREILVIHRGHVERDRHFVDSQVGKSKVKRREDS